jgi:hypothetical protein
MPCTDLVQWNIFRVLLIENTVQKKLNMTLPAMEEYLAETYGITVYQEQVMLLSQKLANFTKGEADVLRKAMGKKLCCCFGKMKPKFIEQGKNGHDEEKLEKIWKDWEALQVMPSIKVTLPVMLGYRLSNSLFKSTLSCRIYGFCSF